MYDIKDNFRKIHRKEDILDSKNTMVAPSVQKINDVLKKSVIFLIAT